MYLIKNENDLYFCSEKDDVEQYINQPYLARKFETIEEAERIKNLHKKVKLEIVKC